jgi:predicted amidophosphoribosyltransferase
LKIFRIGILINGKLVPFLLRANLEQGGMMKTNVKSIHGGWNLGYVLDKHTISSTAVGQYENGRTKWDTTYTEVGGLVYQMKYRTQLQHAPVLAKAVADVIVPMLPEFSMIIPMPATKLRSRQPVTEVANALGQLLKVPVIDGMLSKAAGGRLLKDLHTREEKDAELAGKITLNRVITDDGRWNALLLDDLHDSGASLDAACAALRQYEKIGDIYVAALTWK